MPANVLVGYYNRYGHIFRMAQALAEDARSVAAVSPCAETPHGQRAEAPQHQAI